MNAPELELEQILDPARLRRVWSSPRAAEAAPVAGPAHAPLEDNDLAFDDVALDDVAEGEADAALDGAADATTAGAADATTVGAADAAPAWFDDEPTRAPITPSDALAAFGALEAEAARLFPAGSDAHRVLSAALPAQRAALERAALAAEAAGGVPDDVAAALAAGLDQLEDLLTALMFDVGWPEG